MKTHIFLLSLCLGLAACGGQGESEGLPTVNLSDLERTTEINLSEVMSDVEYIKLETTDSCLIDENPLFCATNDYIFAIGGHDQIYRFSREDGRFMGAIGTIGQGPDDYMRVSKLLPVDERDQIVAARNAHGLILYSFDGKTKGHVVKPENSEISNVVKINSDTYAGYLYNNEEKLYLFDQSGTIKKRIANTSIQPMLAVAYPACDFFVYNNQVNLLDILDDTIRAIDPVKGQIPRYCLNWGSHKILLEKMTNPALTRDFCFSQKALETDNSLIIQYLYQEGPRLSLYDKKTGSIRHTGKGGTLENDLDQGAPVTLSSLADGELVGYVTAEALLDWAEDQPADWADNPRLAAFRSVDEMDNPVVVIGKAK